MSKHTQGNWEVGHGGHGSSSGFVIDEYFVLSREAADDVAIAADIIDPITGKPSESNAKLISAAPEMLAALRIALLAINETTAEMTVGDRFTNAGQSLIDALMPCRAAIAKATGEPA